MERSFHAFLERLKENRSLRPLYWNADFKVELKTERSRILIAVDKHGCHRLYSLNEDVNVKVFGKKKDLVRLLDGKERLLTMAERQVLHVEGPYRLLLKLESLFLLNGVDRYFLYKLS